MYTIYTVSYKRKKRVLSNPIGKGDLKHCIRVACNKDFETVLVPE